MDLHNLTPLKENTTRFLAIIEELIPARITEGIIESERLVCCIKSEQVSSKLRSVTWHSSLFVMIVTKD